MGLVTSLIVGSTVLAAGSQIAAGNAARRTADDVTEEGARLAREAVASGEESAKAYEMDVAQLLGRQRASFAASNVDTTTGSAAAIRSETEAFGAKDATMIRENAMREAFGLRRNAELQAKGLRGQATGQYLGAAGDILSLGANAWDSYQNRGSAGRTPRTPGARSNIRVGARPARPAIYPGL